MDLLYLSIIAFCWQFGEVKSFLHLTDKLGMDYSLADRRLRRIEARDRRLKVKRSGQGRPLHIHYEFGDDPPSIVVKGRRVITFPKTLLYRK